MSTETRDALLEALKVYLNDRFGYRGPDDGSDPDDFDDDADAILAMVRATDAPVAEWLRECPHCGRSLDPRPYDANRDEPTALATPEPDA